MNEKSDSSVLQDAAHTTMHQATAFSIEVAMSDRKNGAVSDRDRRGRFTVGNKGKPRGAKHRATKLAMDLLESGIEDIAGVVVEAARSGDLMAARIVLDKLIPSAKERHVELPDLPNTTTAAGVSQAQQCILEAVATGEITPNEASTLSGILETRRKALETQELEVRIAALESAGQSQA